MSSLWAQYQKEFRGVETLEWPWGFVTYEILPNMVLSIEDVFVIPSARGEGRLHTMWDAVVEAGRKADCTLMITSVDLVARTAAASLQMQLHLGLVPFKAESGRIWLKRSIVSGEQHG